MSKRSVSIEEKKRLSPFGVSQLCQMKKMARDKGDHFIMFILVPFAAPCFLHLIEFGNSHRTKTFSLQRYNSPLSLIKIPP